MTVMHPTEKMKSNIVGIVAEFNPMHFGHRYLIEEAKRRTGASAVVCALSGNFVQRGAPAVLDKWQRTEIALQNHVDLVLEIPTVHCLGNAAVYAASGVQLLEAFGGVTHIAFGSESGDLEGLRKVSDYMREHESELRRKIALRRKSGESYPAARENVLREFDMKEVSMYQASNDILALEYLKNIRALKPVAVQRQGAGYHETDSPEKEFWSSTGIRKAISENRLPEDRVPWSSEKLDFHISEEKWFQGIRYAILMKTPEELDSAPGGGEGLGNRLKEAARKAQSLDELILNTKSKRYTYTRISRWLYQILLGITVELQNRSPEYLRVLGFSERGREILRETKRNEWNRLPFVDNINKCGLDSRMLQMDVLASDVYNLMTGQSVWDGSDNCRRVVIK